MQLLVHEKALSATAASRPADCLSIEKRHLRTGCYWTNINKEGSQNIGYYKTWKVRSVPNSR